jgi:hypothetical protein
MATYRTTCPHCQVGIKYNETLFGQTRSCPNCGQAIILQAPVEGAEAPPPEPPVPPEQVAPLPPPPPPPPPPREGPLMPERMKANRVLAGRVCRECNIAVELGDDVYNCQQCGGTMHLGCYEKRGACARCTPASAETGWAPGQVEPPPPPATVPCRICGEPILAAARKCRHCGEYQSEADRDMVHRRIEAAAGAGHLFWWEILLGILCGGVGCILGIVYAAQGKPKGWKLIVLSILCLVFWNIINLFLQDGLNRRLGH